MPQMSRYRITLTDLNRNHLTRVIRELEIQILDHGRHQTADKGYSVEAIVSAEDIKRLEAIGYIIENRYDVDKIGKDRQGEVGRGNRYERAVRR